MVVVVCFLHRIHRPKQTALQKNVARQLSFEPSVPDNFPAPLLKQLDGVTPGGGRDCWVSIEIPAGKILLN